MRRRIAIILSLCLLAGLLWIPAGAAEPDCPTGYVFKLKEDLPLRLMSVETGSVEDVPFADGFYTVQSREELQRLIDSGMVDCWQEDSQLELMDAIPNDPDLWMQYYVDMLNAYSVWDQKLDGSGVTVAFIDSGICLTHEDLNGADVSGYNFLGNGNYSQYLTDENNHGSLGAGLLMAQRDNKIGIAGLTPRAKLLMLRAFGGNTTDPWNTGSGSISRAISAVEYAVRKNVDVLNMSFGITADDIKGSNAALSAALQDAADAGMLLVASAGNYNETYPGYVYPAAYDHVISVGNVDSAGRIAPTSQVNDQVWVCAPGTAIYSLGNETKRYSTQTGTSFSAPIVSAMAVMAKQVNPNITQSTFAAILQNAAVDVGVPGRDSTYGWGIVTFPNLLRQFKRAPYTVQTRQVTGGTVQVNQTSGYYAEIITVDAKPGDGWMLKNILVDGEPISDCPSRQDDGKSFFITGNHTVSAEFTAPLLLTNQALTLEDGFRLNAYMDPSKTEFRRIKAEITDSWGAVQTVDGERQGELLCFPVLDGSALYMTLPYTVRLMAEDDPLHPVYGGKTTFSVRQYAETLLEGTDGSGKLEQALVAMLNFGAESQKVQGFQTMDLANKNVTAEQQKHQTYQVGSLQRQDVGKMYTNVGGVMSGVGLGIGDRLYLQFNFDGMQAKEAEETVCTVQYTDHGGTKHYSRSAPVAGKAGYFCKVPLNPADLGAVITFTALRNGQETVRLEDSLESCICRNYGANSGAYDGFFDALTVYGWTLRDYFLSR